MSESISPSEMNAIDRAILRADVARSKKLELDVELVRRLVDALKTKSRAPADAGEDY